MSKILQKQTTTIEHVEAVEGVEFEGEVIGAVDAYDREVITWVTCTKDDIEEGDIYRKGSDKLGWVQQEYKIVVIPTEFMVLPKDVLQAFPSGAYTELRDYSNNLGNSNEDRGNAYKILDILKGGESLNALSPNFIGLLTWASSVLTSFTQEDIDNLFVDLAVPTPSTQEI